MKKLKGLSLILVCIIALGFMIISCDGGGGGSGDYAVKYEITGPKTTATFVNYRNESGNIDTINNASIPWDKTIYVSGKYIGASCSASFSSSGGTYIAKIFVNGKEVASTTSSSGHVSVVYVID